MPPGRGVAVWVSTLVLLAARCAWAQEGLVQKQVDLDQVAPRVLLSLVEHPELMVRLLALSELADRGTAEAVGGLRAGLEHDDPVTCYSTVRLLRSLPMNDLQAGLTREMVDRVAEFLELPKARLLTQEACAFFEVLAADGKRRSKKAWGRWWQSRRAKLPEAAASPGPAPAEGGGAREEGRPAGGAAAAGGGTTTDRPDPKRPVLGRELDLTSLPILARDRDDHIVTRDLDLVLVMDVTDSMKGLIDEAKQDATRLIRALGVLFPAPQIGLVTYKDEPITVLAPTDKERRLLGVIRACKAVQGGDLPEGVDKALEVTLRMPLRPNVCHAVLLIGDAPPHAADLPATITMAERAKRRGTTISVIRCNPVQARWPANVPVDFFQQLVDASGGSLHTQSANDRLVRTMIRQALGEDLYARLEVCVDGLLDLADELSR
jgi:Mg-chelatase subunit ChlD